MNITKILCSCVTLIYGFILAIVRLMDPHYQLILKIAIYECFGIVIKDDNLLKIQSKPLSSFLTESLNLELINIILIGIENFSDITNSEKNMREPKIDVEF